jgi:glutamine synthetase
MAAVTCPTVNSYKRFGVGAPQSGATWAPAYATYGGNNRTQMLRVPEGGRVENRACDGSANPYLALAVQLAAGLDGIDRGLDPGEPNRDNLHVIPADEVARRGIRVLPPTLLHTRPASWSPTTSCARHWARRRAATTSTTTRRSSARSSRRGTPR